MIHSHPGTPNPDEEADYLACQIIPFHKRQLRAALERLKQLKAAKVNLIDPEPDQAKSEANPFRTV